MRTLVVGAGAVGGYFGALLVEAGRDVTFLVREGRARVLRDDGLTVVRPDGRLSVTPATVTAAEITDPFDLVLLSVKSFGLEQAMSDLAPAIGPETVIIPLLNGMRHVETLEDRFGTDHGFGGLCLVVTQLDADGSIRQLAPGASMAYGELNGGLSERARAIDAELRGAGFEAELTDAIRLRMWEKWLLLGSGGALTTLLRGNVGAIEAVPNGVDTATAILAEALGVATASGYPPRPETLARLTKILTEPGSSFTTSMYRDLVAGNDVEAEQILGDLVVRANKLGLAVPLFAAADAGLEVYRAGRASR
jgi:2-dehydropantoate 2-reductase